MSDPRALVERLQEHHRRADGLLVEFHTLTSPAPLDWRGGAGPGQSLDAVGFRPALATQQDVADWLARISPAQQVSLAVVAAEEVSTTSELVTKVVDCVRALTQACPVLTADDIRIVLSFDDRPNGAHLARVRVAELALAAIERLREGDPAEARQVAGEAADRFDGWNPLPFINVEKRWRPQVWGLRDRARWLAGRPPASEPDQVGPLLRVDAFGSAAIAMLGADVGAWPTGVLAYLEHCAGARATLPSARWKSRCVQLLDAVHQPGQQVRRLLDLLVGIPPLEFMADHGRTRRLLHGGQGGGNDDLVRGLVWSVPLLGEDWAVPVLQAVAECCMKGSHGRSVRETPVSGEKVAYGCVTALAEVGSPDAVRALRHLADGGSNRAVLSRIDAEVEKLAGRLGVPAEELFEAHVADFGLDVTGARTVVLGGLRGRLVLDDRRGAVARWEADGREPTRPPAVYPQEAAELRRLAKELARAAMGERRRLEELMVAGRVWTLATYRERYVDHPLTGWFARRLLWVVEPVNGSRLVGLPGSGPAMFKTGQGPVRIEGEAAVSLWHPAGAAESEVASVRALIWESGTAQPFRQAWRETYDVDEVEASTQMHSLRFAGHILNAPQLYAIARQRGWSGGFLSGAWDGGNESVAQRDLPAAGVRAQWSVAAFDPGDGRAGVALAVSDRVRFVPIGEADGPPIPLGQIPPVAFSETMRDLDLITSAASVATDPFWLEKFAGPTSGPTSGSGYRESLAPGGTAATVAERRRIVALVLDRLADRGAGRERCHLGERTLTVAGRLRTYSIDLATANVRVDPPGRWLAFDAGGGRRRRQTLLPPPVASVDDDVILERILARAVLLLSDDKITDRSLLRQIQDRGARR